MKTTLLLITLLISGWINLLTAQAAPHETPPQVTSIWVDDGKADYPPFYSPEESCERIMRSIAWEYLLYKSLKEEGVFGGFASMNTFEIRPDSAFYKDANGVHVDEGDCSCENGKLTVNWTKKLGRTITYQLHFFDSVFVEFRYFDYKKSMEYLFSRDTALLTGNIDNPTKIIGRILAFDPFKKIEEGTYENGKKTGLWKVYQSNGVLEEEGTYVNGEKDGDWKLYFKSGPLEGEGAFKAGKKEGLWKHYFEDGQLESTGQYKEDKEHGEWKRYHGNGQLYAIRHYNEGKRTGDWKFYSKTGQLTHEGAYKDSYQHGQWVEYHENGTVRSQGAYDMGSRKGIWKHYYENGQLEKEGILEGSIFEIKEEGFWQFYYENGQLKEKGHFINGKKDSLWLFYYEDGSLYEEGYYENDLPSGPCKIYYPDGTLEEQGNYLNGELDGEWSVFYDNGKLQIRNLWKEGRLLEMLECRDGLGNELNCGTLKNGNGTVIIYDFDGKVLEEREYKDGY